MFPLYGKHLQNRVFKLSNPQLYLIYVINRVIKIVSIKCLTNEYKVTKNRFNEETKSLFVDIFIKSLIFCPTLKLI